VFERGRKTEPGRHDCLESPLALDGHDSPCSRVVAPKIALPARFFTRPLSLRSLGLAVSGNQRLPGVSGSEIRDLRKSFALPV